MKKEEKIVEKEKVKTEKKAEKEKAKLEKKENKAQKLKSKNNKAQWIFMVIVCVILCVVNIGFSYKFRGAEGSNVFTTISGWVSGIATIILGLIAVFQNKKYVLASTKKEVKDAIQSEKVTLVEICDEIAQFSIFKKPLIILFKTNVTEIDLISYEFEVDLLKEELLTIAHKIQLLNYIPKNMLLFVEKINDMQKNIDNEYKNARQHYNNDKLLGNDIKNIKEFIAKWTLEFHQLRKNAVDELSVITQTIDTADSVLKIHKILENVEQETKETHKKINKMLLEALRKK